MDNSCLIAEFRNTEDFRTAVAVLEKAKFSPSEVSTIIHADDESIPALNAVTDSSSESPPTEKTVAATTLAGGTLGAALGTMTLMGPMLVAGPIFGMAAGAVGGSVLSAIKSGGFNHGVAEDYETKVRDGAMLIIVTGDKTRLSEARQALKTVGPASLETFPQ
jgi:uncharacterized membrane protein